ncbi:hypothetical protein AALF15_00240 [Corynebacteriaceae bacterium 7-707]
MRRAAAPLLVTLAILALRGWQLSQRTFYWDDLVIPARFRDTGLWVPYDGHLMPGSAALQILADSVAPLQWWLPAVVTLATTALAALLWWRLLGRLTDQRTVRVTAFTALMFSPFLGTASGWWSAGVNALAWQVIAAGVGLIVLSAPARAPLGTVLARSLAAGAVLLAGLVMTEKVLTVVPATVAVALVLRAAGRGVPDGRVAPRVPWTVGVVPVALTAFWAGLYLYLVERGSGTPSPGLDGIATALGSSVVPGVLGGPWSWDRWDPSPAFSTTAGPVQVAAAVVVAGLVVVYLVCLRRRLTAGLLAVALSVGYLAVVLLLLRQGRTGEGSTDLLARGMHYYADWWSVTVLLLVAAATGTLPRDSRGTAGAPAARRVLAGTACLLFIASSTASTVTWVTEWSDDQTAGYLAGLREAVAQARDSGVPLPDQNTPLEVLTPLMSPYNTVGSVGGSLHGGDGVGPVTTQPRIVTPDGRIVDAEVLDIARSAQGDSPDCGVRVEAGRPTVVPVEPALPFGDWTWEFTATADQPVTVRVSTPNGLEDEARWRARTVGVDVGTDLVTRWVGLSGGGGTLLVEVDGPPGSHVCVGAGAVGPLVPR